MSEAKVKTIFSYFQTFGNTSITSEEDEILKKEREIIEVLEKEEQWRYGNKNSHSAEQNDIGTTLEKLSTFTFTFALCSLFLITYD